VQILPSPSLVSLDWHFGFYGGEVYLGYFDSFYIDMLVGSFFIAKRIGIGIGGVGYWGILQPAGIGFVIKMQSPYYKSPLYLTVGMLRKVNDNWTPPYVE